jgi:adhesin transport system membrane fusion protein
LLVEADIAPSDIAFVKIGQEATVKLTAYDYSIYGGLSGKVEQISADTFANDQGESFYRILVRTGDRSLHTNEQELEILPGMVAQVDIKTGKKSVLDYVLKPLMRAKMNAFTER